MNINDLGSAGVKCLTPHCQRLPAAATGRGLCLICYGKAKKYVERGDTTWGKLEQMGLALAPEGEFDKAFKDALVREKDHDTGT